MISSSQTSLLSVLLVLFLWGTLFNQGLLGQLEPEITNIPPDQDAKGDAILDADAQFDLGDMYFEGYGVAQNFEKAAKWFRNAAQQGHAEAQAGLGYLYFKGKGGPQDYSEAAKWFRKAAEQGLGSAQKRTEFKIVETGREPSFFLKLLVTLTPSWSGNWTLAGKCSGAS